jgi:regulator of protease activity HflC (stomatin/prohibitin superfamily)
MPLTGIETGLMIFWNVLFYILALPFVIIGCCCGFFIVNPMETYVLTVYAKVWKVIDKPGI